jgi:two-component system, cell cycle sensor histidine kinase and response regulator CckA
LSTERFAVDPIRVLLVARQHSRYADAHALLTGRGDARYQVEWAASADDAFSRLAGSIDVGLVGDRVGSLTGIEFIRTAIGRGGMPPLILLTADDRDDLDAAALDAGAIDVLDAMHMTGRTLHRALGHAVRYRKALDLLREREERFYSERRRTEAQGAHLTAIVRSSHDAIVSTALDGTVLSWNPAAERLLGYAASEIIGHSIRAILTPERAAAALARFKALADGRVREYEGIGVRKDGSHVTVDVALSPIHDETGRVAGASAVLRDITGRKIAEEALHNSEERMRFALSAANIGVWDTDIATGRTTWSESMSAVTGQPPHAFPATFDAFVALVDPDDRPPLMDAIGHSQSGGTFELEFRMRAADGSLRWQECKGRVLADEHGTPLRILAVGIDITARKQLEEQFRQSQKMEAIGHLAGGIAHDFNNLLTAILGYTELTLDSLAETDRRRADVAEIQKAAQSAASLTRQLLAFSRRQILQPRVLDLNAVVQHVNALVRRVIGEDIELVVRCAPDVARVSADQGQLEQVIMNLVVNARDAMPRGGCLTIETSNVQLDATFVGGHIGSREGPHVRLAVGDTGAGMSRAVQQRLFEPFFTTKARGKGTGLGLATVYGIVKQSGGSIWVDSEIGRGTTFSIFLPVAPTTPEPSGVEASGVLAIGGTETILLVEDQPEVRAIAATVLRRAGYTILEAHGGIAAIELSRAYGNPIDLLLTDVVMPGMSGQQLAEVIRAERGEIRVLFTSGYTDHGVVNQGVLQPGLEFLQKPFTPVGLLQKVREVLAQPRGASSAPL